MDKQNQLAVAGQQNGQIETGVGKAPGAKLALISAMGLAGLTAIPAHAAIDVPQEILDVFTQLGTAFGVLMAAGAVLFGVIRGGVALFKLASRVFSAAGA